MLQEKGNGCRLTFENVHWAYFNEPAVFEELKKHSGVLACLDNKQAMQGGGDVRDYLSAVGERLKTVHLCDFHADGRLALPGKGIFDFTDFFKRLKDTGYDGPLLMEVYSGDYQTYGDLRRSYEYLQNCLEKI
jgi:sugar phosphate isomerase/epimerase